MFFESSILMIILNFDYNNWSRYAEQEKSAIDRSYGYLNP